VLILQDRDQKIRQIGIEIKTLPQQRKNLEPNLPDFLVPILQNQQFFQLRLHSENAID
jgi:hypothetical protein